MTKIKVKIINTNCDKYTADIEVHDDIIIHKENQHFKSLIERVINDSKMQEIDEIKIAIKMEW